MFAARSLLSVPVVLAALVSVATLACSGSGSSGFGGDGGAGGTGGNATPQSGCAALTKWATGCNLTVDQAGCEAQATGHTAAQLEAATACTQTTSCDQAKVVACVQKALASSPQPNSSGGLGSSGGTVPDAGGGGGGGTTCETCTRASCKSEVTTCEGMPSCLALYNCVVAAAGDQDQVQACVDQDDSGLPQLKALAQCQTAKCGTVCQ